MPKSLISTLALTGLLALSGCGNDKEDIYVFAIPGNKSEKRIGGISFKDRKRGISYIDEGFDGTLDRVSYQDKVIRKGDPGFEDYIKEYEKARRIASEGK